MSDFLTTLAARALHKAPVVQPRLASRFEAPPAGGRVMPDNSFGGEVESFLESPQPLATITHPEPHSRAREMQSDEDTSPIRSMPSLEQPFANEPSLVVMPVKTHVGITSPTSSPIEPMRPHEQPVVLESPRAPFDRVPRSDQRESTNRLNPRPPADSSVTEKVNERRTPADRLSGPIEHDFPDSLNLETPSGFRPASKNANERHSRRDVLGMELPPVADSTHRLEPALHTAANAPSSGSFVAVPQLTPALAPSQQLDRPLAAPEPAPEPAPMIRVTIGRVEVRAIMPAAPAPPRSTPARATPSLSLDEYLRLRTEGRR